MTRPDKREEDKSQPRLIEHAFQTIEEFSESLKGMDLNVYQLDKGDFNGNTSSIAANEFMLNLRTSQAKHVQVGSVRDAYYAMLFPLDNHEYIFNGRFCRHNNQAVSTSNTENTLVLPKGHKHFTLLVDSRYFRQYYGDIEAAQFCKAFEVTGKSKVSPVKKRSLTNRLQELFKKTMIIPEAGMSGLMWQDLTDEVFYVINEYFIYHLDKFDDKVTNKERLLHRALDYIHSQDIHILSVSDVIQGVHVSSRSLQYCFANLLGMSPKNYIIKLRMNAMRKELLTADPDTVTLTEIANKYGVLNIGRFKQDYEKQFNESPRETLKKTARA